MSEEVSDTKQKQLGRLVLDDYGKHQHIIMIIAMMCMELLMLHQSGRFAQAPEQHNTSGTGAPPGNTLAT